MIWCVEIINVYKRLRPLGEVGKRCHAVIQYLEIVKGIASSLTTKWWDRAPETQAWKSGGTEARAQQCTAPCVLDLCGVNAPPHPEDITLNAQVKTLPMAKQKFHVKDLPPKEPHAQYALKVGSRLIR